MFKKLYTSLAGRWTINTEPQLAYFNLCRDSMGPKGRKLFSITPYHVKAGDIHLEVNAYEIKESDGKQAA